MAEIHRLPAERQILQEASQWIARLNSDDLTAEDRRRFESWRQAHPMHRRAFEELTRTVERFAAVRPLVRAVAFGQSMNEAVTGLANQPVGTRKPWRRLVWAAAAAVIATGLALVGYLGSSGGHVYATGIGEHATISLADGSTLELDSDSRARVDFSAGSRIVHLQRGEAFFKVVHNSRRPFWVLGGGVWVRDVGTEFNFDLDAGGVRVTVSEGEVKVGADPILQHVPFGDAALRDAPALSVLSAGQEAQLRGTAVKVLRLTPVQLARAVSWRAGTLYFENQPLSAVVRELKRYTPLHIQVTDPRLRRLAVDGTFRASPQGVRTFLQMLHQGLGLSVRREAGRVTIEPAPTSAR